jgi:hypothetical protein
MKDFIQWLKEDGLRTSLGAYPPAYGVGQYPPAYFAPMSATAFLSLSKFHGDKDTKPKKKTKGKKKKGDKKKD